jgi:hypothetical protein
MKSKYSKDAPEPRDRKRDRDGVKASLRKARKAKGARRQFEQGEKA